MEHQIKERRIEETLHIALENWGSRTVTFFIPEHVLQRPVEGGSVGQELHFFLMDKCKKYLSWKGSGAAAFRQEGRDHTMGTVQIFEAPYSDEGDLAVILEEVARIARITGEPYLFVAWEHFWGTVGPR